MQRILIVDDEGDVRGSIKSVLDLAGYTVRTAENAADALDQLERGPIDVVITDIIMPKMNGVQAIESIRKAFPRVRIVAISGGGNFGLAAYQPPSDSASPFVLRKEWEGSRSRE